MATQVLRSNSCQSSSSIPIDAYIDGDNGKNNDDDNDDDENVI